MQNKLESQYAAKREAHLNEVADFKQQLEIRGTEIRNLNATVESLKGVNEELKVRFRVNTGSDETLMDVTPISVLSPSLQLALKVARTSPKALKTLNEQGRRLMYSLPSSMVSRNLSCATCKTAARRFD